MATSAFLLPTFPRIFFLYIEPILISYGAILNYIQLPALLNIKPLPQIPTLILPALVTEHLFHVFLYGLIILLAAPPSKRLVQLHIAVLIIADFTHWLGLFSTMIRAHPAGRGLGMVVDYGSWDAETWQLVVYPVGTLLIKVATLRGWFGRIRDT